MPGKNDKNKVVVGSVTAIGGVSLAPLGTALPTDVSTALADTYKHGGYVTSDGFDREEKVDTDTILALGGDVVKVVKKGTSATVSFTFLEYLNPVVQKAIYGDDNVSITEATAEHGNQLNITGVVDLMDEQVMIIDLTDGDARGRLVFGDAQITDRDKYSAKDDDATGRNVTWNLLPMGYTDDGKAVFFKEYWDDGRKTAA
jgi:hypothetical protein